MIQMAERTGLEPATPGVTGRYSNQLNYRSGWGGESYPIDESSFKLFPSPGSRPLAILCVFPAVVAAQKARR